MCSPVIKLSGAILFALPTRFGIWGGRGGGKGLKSTHRRHPVRYHSVRPTALRILLTYDHGSSGSFWTSVGLMRKVNESRRAAGPRDFIMHLLFCCMIFS